MTLRKLLVAIPVLVILGIVVLFFSKLPQNKSLYIHSQDDSSDITSGSEKSVTGVSNMENKYDDPWDEWIDKRTELIVHMFMTEMPGLFTDRDSLWEQTYPESVEKAKKLRKNTIPHRRC